MAFLYSNHPRRMHLLGIAIPTFCRVTSYSSLLSSLSSQILCLDTIDQQSIKLKVLENPSIYSSEKRFYYESLSFGVASARFLVNNSNIGGDNNIAQAYQSMPDCLYTWVVGDDERLRSNCIANVLSQLRSAPQPALVLLTDGEYSIKSSLLSIRSWPTYLDFARACNVVQPHLLIAHTLISCNVIRTDCIDVSVYNFDLSVVKARLGLNISFAHMKAIVCGLSRSLGSASEIRILVNPSLDTSHRVPPEESFSCEQIHILYRHYINWLFSELGLDTCSLAQYSGMMFFYPRPGLIVATLSMHGILKAFRRFIGRALRFFTSLLNRFLADPAMKCGSSCR